MSELESCTACAGLGSRPVERGGFIMAWRTCRACQGDGTQIRANLELLADLLSLPSVQEEAS